ncbi:MAG: hypothetical protein FWG32_05355 [Oscillospiraceae bacterium]|nr:hypothetical protein [Oscillospiraceae bacterium]
MGNRKQKKKKRYLIFMPVIAVLIAGTGVLLFVFKPWTDDDLERSATALAEAVATTKVEVYDGIWDPQRYTDELYYPVGITLSGDKLIIADCMCDRIQIIEAGKNIRVGIPGQYGLSYFDSGALIDGYRENAMFMKPAGVAVAPDGSIIICDTGNNVIRRMDSEFVVTVAGNGSVGFKDGKETDARFNAPRAAAADTAGIIYVADTMNHCIRRIDRDGNVTLFAGGPEEQGWRDGELKDARFCEPSGIAVSPSGDIYVSDSANHCIRKISNGTVTTLAGAPGEIDRATGYSSGGYTDGENENARFNFPRGVALMPDGSLLVADAMNHAVRIIEAGKTRTLAGNGQAGQYYSSAENMALTRPEGVCTDGEFLYISDTVNNRVVSVPMTDRLMEGRPSRYELLSKTGITTDSRYSYNGDIRVYIDDERVDMGRIRPWITADSIYVPIRPLFEALGAIVTLNEVTDVLTVSILDTDTRLHLNEDYFIMKGVAVTTIDEIVRLFPYTFEWFSEFSLIALHIPSDLRG